MTDLSDFKRLVYEPETKALRARIAELEALVSAHHAAGVLDGTFTGDECPVCSMKKGNGA